MAKLEAVLGLSSVSARLFKYGLRVHGQTVTRFAALIALHDSALNKQVALLSGATLEFLATGSRHAGASAWKSVRTLESAIERLPMRERESAVYHLERYVQMLLARDAELATLIGDDIKAFRIVRLQRLAELALEQPSADSAIIGQWRKGIFGNGGDVLRIFKHFEAVVSLDSPAVAKASAYIRKNAESILRAVEAAEVGNLAALRGHLSGVRGYLGEAYALLSPVWRARHRVALREAKAIARKLEPRYEVLPLSQLENGIRLSVKEGADQMILLFNRESNEAITVLSAQVKIANTSEALEQSLNDVLRRELRPAGLLEFVYQGKAEAVTLVQHELVTAQRYVLNAAESRIPAADIELLKKHGAEVSEIVLDLSVNQFSLLAIQMIEEGLTVFNRAAP